MRNILIILALLCFINLFAYEWTEIIPGDHDVNDVIFTPEIFAATSQGILIQETGGWQLHSTNLPVLQLKKISEAELIFIMGNGSWSDGVYKYNLETAEHQVLEYTPWPNFIYFCENDNHYYVGFEQGLLTSEDGETWNEVEYFNMNTCLAMITYGNNYIVSSDYVYYSYNSGVDWQQTETCFPFSAFAVREEVEPIFLGIFPGSSYSSGLYSSENGGANWEVVFWDIYLTDILWLFNNMTFVSFADEDEVEPGVVSYYFEDESFTYYNTGLPEATVNRLTFNPLVNCLNVVACSSQGAYMLTGFGTNTGAEIVPVLQEVQIYPNPFNPETTIHYNVQQATNVKIDVYNQNGQKVITLVNDYKPAGGHTVLWQGKDNQGNSVASGVYFCKLQAAQEVTFKKMLLLH
jgi:hypothetical protein